MLTKQAAKDAQNLVKTGNWSNAESLLEVLAISPFQNLPPYEKLVENLAGFYSRRINIQHPMVYQIFKEINIVKAIRTWSHYK